MKGLSQGRKKWGRGTDSGMVFAGPGGDWEERLWNIVIVCLRALGPRSN